MKSKYVKRSKISEAKFRSIIMYFGMELDSRKIAALTSLNRNTINRYIGRIRSRIVELCEAQAHVRQIDLAGAEGFQGTRSSSDYRKAVEAGLPVFGIRFRNDHIHTSLLPQAIRPRLRRFIQGKQCEFRFNNRRNDLYQLLLKRFRENPLI